MKKTGFILLFCSFMFTTGIAQTIDKDSLQSGDLIFLHIDGGPLSRAITSVTPHYKGIPFDHVGILFIKNHHTYVIEAIGDSVQVNTLETVTGRSIHKVYIGRLQPPLRYLREKAVQFALRQRQKPYNSAFLMDTGSYYCSQLVYDAFKYANNGQEIFRLFPMTYKAPGSDNYFPEWKKYFDDRHQPIPQGKPGCNPGSIAISKELHLFMLKKEEPEPVLQ